MEGLACAWGGVGGASVLYKTRRRTNPHQTHIKQLLTLLLPHCKDGALRMWILHLPIPANQQTNHHPLLTDLMNPSLAQVPVWRNHAAGHGARVQERQGFQAEPAADPGACAGRI
jgi:hypothetical protein